MTCKVNDHNYQNPIEGVHRWFLTCTKCGDRT